eukprot:TRINITY_DN13586_c0_g1_i3.p1 TRINITY_DN13586_c0_g1~~TRINITY_DN13586_c0_g1_i3.p1  ORF type:complete len:174 (+),score=42.02 TRINITY_DN13586_c0_g1_i3:125-646(+)
MQGQQLTMQIQVLTDFFHKHDRTMVPSVQSMVAQHRGTAPSLSQEAFQQICNQCNQRYGEHPLQLHLQNVAIMQPCRPLDDVDPSQLAILGAFYRKHQPSRSEHEIREVLRRRQRGLAALSAEDFQGLCGQLASKYGEHPQAVFSQGAVEGASPSTKRQLDGAECEQRAKRSH